MKNKRLIGTGVALVTPFSENGKIDELALANLVENVISSGVDYLVVLGTTAETTTLSKIEKELVKKIIKNVNNCRLPMVIGIGGNSTENVIQEIKETNLSDYEAILSVSPYYNKPSQEGVYQHFKKIAESTSHSILLYNVPGRTASNISAQTTIRLANDFENVIGIKEASGNLVQFMEILKNKPTNFLVISGDDITALPSTLIGGDGVISVLAQGLPQDFSQMIRLAILGDVKKSTELHYKIMEGCDLIFKEGNPVGIKALLNLKGITTSQVRLPLVRATNSLKDEIAYFLNNL